MYLIQLFLPLVKRPQLAPLREELTGRFGGVTVYARAPAHGEWKPDAVHGTEHDDMVIVEVMANDLDRNWWGALRRRLEEQLGEEEILIRALHCERL